MECSPTWHTLECEHNDLNAAIIKMQLRANKNALTKRPIVAVPEQRRNGK